ncbi:hypothetical protein [Acetobacter oeni]|uniref:Uncharacterized protein n=1 Tax=Acetobacter oeni TaxID=304077 RepID=A0A511XJM9_9PROT|nr:hypothetical protein [Acetobacter oeni]MBB3883350.1 putative membrane protein [Acetobacter oeni]NHO19482.1 hypothetical protein [Acetobacter oeni]GBR00772.1 GCN5-like N-acetyltransferase [Acetobacter oeni LMG 21952]GEN63131.1 hypothetical protein AOE01nite_13550 [Acetobacter oeni]
MTSVVRRGLPMKWSHGLACGAALAWLPGYSLLAGVLMLPLIVVYLTDRSRDQDLVRMMLPYEFAALMHPLHILWNEDGSLEAAISLLLMPETVMIGWCAAGAGWLVLEMALISAKLIRQYKARSKKAEIATRLKELHEEWAEDTSSSEIQPSA